MLAGICVNHKAGKFSSMITALIIYSGRLTFKSNDVLIQTLDFDVSELTNLFQRTFGPGYFDNFQGSLARKCNRNILPLRKTCLHIEYLTNCHSQCAG